MFKGRDIYMINDDCPSEQEINNIIDDEAMADYEQYEWNCSCGSKFDTEEAVVDDNGDVSCKDCGELIMCGIEEDGEEEGIDNKIVDGFIDLL